MTKPLCGLEDCDCGYTIEKLEGRLDCGKDADCADEVETQAQCLKHYELYVEQELAAALHLKEGWASALGRLQQRFNEVWKQHQRMLLALENARDAIHRAHCTALSSLPQECWKECEEAMDAMLEAGWLPSPVLRGSKEGE